MFLLCIVTISKCGTKRHKATKLVGYTPACPPWPPCTPAAAPPPLPSNPPPPSSDRRWPPPPLPPPAPAASPAAAAAHLRTCRTSEGPTKGVSGVALGGSKGASKEVRRVKLPQLRLQPQYLCVACTSSTRLLPVSVRCETSAPLVVRQLCLKLVMLDQHTSCCAPAVPQAPPLRPAPLPPPPPLPPRWAPSARARTPAGAPAAASASLLARPRHQIAHRQQPYQLALDPPTALAPYTQTSVFQD
eukprot:2400121-Pyramimonas_sp.AAC.1